MKVVHCKKFPYDVYVGGPSIWGNPFTHLEAKSLAEVKVSSREEAVSMFEEWLDGKHPTVAPLKRLEILRRISELKGKILGCWCSPLSCHGDILLRRANE